MFIGSVAFPPTFSPAALPFVPIHTEEAGINGFNQAELPCRMCVLFLTGL